MRNGVISEIEVVSLNALKANARYTGPGGGEAVEIAFAREWARTECDSDGLVESTSDAIDVIHLVPLSYVEVVLSKMYTITSLTK